MRFTRHAKNRLRLHRLSPADVEALLQEPQLQSLGRDGKHNVFGTVRGKRVRVVYVIEDGETIVVTVASKRRPQP